MLHGAARSADMLEDGPRVWHVGERVPEKGTELADAEEDGQQGFAPLQRGQQREDDAHQQQQSCGQSG